MYRVITASTSTGKTVQKVIADLWAKNIDNRLQKLKAAGAPKIILQNLEEKLQECRAGKVKVNGMARKYKVSNEEVLELYQANAVGNYYKDGRQRTTILKMVTPVGTFYYDYYGNKISATMESLDAWVSESEFRALA